MNLKSLNDSKNLYEEIKKKYQEIENKYSKIQIELLKKEKEYEKIKSENDKFKKKNNNDTSSDYPWPKEFCDKWENLSKNLIMDCFENCSEDNLLLTKIINFTIKIVYNITRIYVNEKIIDLFKCLGISNPNQDDIIFFFEKFKVLLFQVYFKTLFHFNDEIYSKIISKIKSEIDTLNINDKKIFNCKEIELINKDLDSREITNFFKELFSICTYMYIHEPILYIDLIFDTDYFFYSKKDYIIIDGFEKENAVCVLILNPPIFKSNCFYRDLKPLVKIIDNPTDEMIEKCKYNQFINEKSKSSKIISVKKNDIEIINDKKEFFDKIIKTPENISNTKGFFNINNSMISYRSFIPVKNTKIKNDIQKKINKNGQYQNIFFKNLEKRINKSLKKNKNIKSNLNTFINKTCLKKIMKNSSLSDSENEKIKREKQKESSRNKIIKLQKQVKNSNFSRNNVTIDFETQSRRYNISDNIIKKMITDYSSYRSIKEKLAIFTKLTYEKRRTYSMNLPSKKFSKKKFNTINLGNKHYKNNNLTHIIQSRNYIKKKHRKKNISEFNQLGIETNLDIFYKKFSSPIIRNKSQKSKINKRFLNGRYSKNIFAYSNSSLTKYFSNINSISESLSYKNIHTVNTLLNNNKKKKVLSQTQPLKLTDDYITLNNDNNLKKADINENNGKKQINNKNILYKNKNKKNKMNKISLCKKSHISYNGFNVNTLKKNRFNSPFQKKIDFNGINKVKNTNLLNCNLSKINQIQTYFFQFQREDEKK